MYEASEYAAKTKNDTAIMYKGNFRMMLDDAKNWAERSGFKEEDIDSVIKHVRERKKHEDSH